jgi:protein-S-isoprenylcysteine O-methyltransferase Ste14
LTLFYNWFFLALWAAYLLYWQAAARGAKSNKRLEPLASRVLRSVLFLLAIALLLDHWVPIPALYLFYLPKDNWAVWFWTGAAVNVLGLGFAIWARAYLGSNWSRSVTIKQNHELITGGPYGMVRHPIYTGLLTGFLGTAVATAQVRGLVALALIYAALWFKLRLEERWMRLQFGEVYEQYAYRVPALVPLPLSRDRRS